MTAHERRHQEDCTSHACFPNPLFRNSLCILFYLVQDRSLALPSGAASTMWLHSLSQNSFRQAGGRGSKLLRHSRHLQISLESCGFRPQNQHPRSPCTPPATIGMRVAPSPLVSPCVLRQSDPRFPEEGIGGFVSQAVFQWPPQGGLPFGSCREQSA